MIKAGFVIWYFSKKKLREISYKGENFIQKSTKKREKISRQHNSFAISHFHIYFPPVFARWFRGIKSCACDCEKVCRTTNFYKAFRFVAWLLHPFFSLGPFFIPVTFYPRLYDSLPPLRLSFGLFWAPTHVHISIELHGRSWNFLLWQFFVLLSSSQASQPTEAIVDFIFHFII